MVHRVAPWGLGLWHSFVCDKMEDGGCAKVKRESDCDGLYAAWPFDPDPMEEARPCTVSIVTLWRKWYTDGLVSVTPDMTAVLGCPGMVGVPVGVVTL